MINNILESTVEKAANEQKSKLEKIEQEVKASVFGLFFHLLKDLETTFWKSVVLLLIEFLQYLSFAFSPEVGSNL